MSVLGRVALEWRYLRGLLRTLRNVRSIAPESAWLACDDLEAAVDKHRDRPAITFEGRTLSFAELDTLANRYARWAEQQKLRRGDTVALFMPNRLEYVAIWFGLSKVGVVTALINNQLSGQALIHCLDVAKAGHVIVDPETAPVFKASVEQFGRKLPMWTVGGGAGDNRDLDRAVKSLSGGRPDRANVRAGITAKNTALYIFTSGTTGLPKAAKVTHMRAQLYMRGFAAGTFGQPQDRYYCALPLYHATGGLCCVGAALLNGACLVVKKRFSAGQFWDDIVREGCTVFVYIGELCRYLVNQPEQPQERKHKLRLAFGNGLRQDTWEQMLARFRIPHILEFYGATEGNVSILNFDGKPGAVGRIPFFLRGRFNVRIIRFDVEGETPVRGPDGLCIEAAYGEVGQMVGQIAADARSNYAGYADKAESEKKILRDVFNKGDAWFATGDLMSQDRQGYFYFVDRVGDTFRWKGENVATSEVAERLLEVPGVKEANVYGVAVPGAEGRAGMAALVAGEGFDVASLAAHAERTLPGYAQPIFLRLLPEIETTGTFKYRKMDLVQDGFDPARVNDALYVHQTSGGYVPLDGELYRRIEAGEFRL